MFKIPAASKLFYSGKKLLIDHAADILTGFTAAGVVLTGIETHKATLRAEEYLRINGYDQANPDTQKVLLWSSRKNYILPAVIGAGTIGAAIGANVINHRHIAGLAAACTVAETALSEQRAKFAELGGDKLLQNVDDELAKDAGHQALSASSSVIDTGHGDQICIDGLTGMVLKACPEWFYSSANRYNQDVNRFGEAPVVNYYKYLLEDVKGPYFIPEWCDYKGYSVGGNGTGIMEFKRPYWEGSADGPAFVVFMPMCEPVTL